MFEYMGDRISNAIKNIREEFEKFVDTKENQEWESGFKGIYNKWSKYISGNLFS